MKKVFFFGLVLFLAAAAAVFAGRAEIDGAINAYEAVVVEAETLAGIPLAQASDFTAVSDKAAAANTAVSAIEGEREWMIQDALKVAELRARFNTAMTNVIVKLLKY